MFFFVHALSVEKYRDLVIEHIIIAKEKKIVMANPLTIFHQIPKHFHVHLYGVLVMHVYSLTKCLDVISDKNIFIQVRYLNE